MIGLVACGECVVGWSGLVGGGEWWGVVGCGG